MKNTIMLNRVECCLLEEVILANYKVFLFPDSNSSQTNKTQAKMIMMR